MGCTSRWKFSKEVRFRIQIPGWPIGRTLTLGRGLFLGPYHQIWGSRGLEVIPQQSHNQGFSVASVQLEPPSKQEGQRGLPHTGDTTYLQVPASTSRCLAAALVAQTVKNLPEVDPDSIPGSGRSPGEQNGCPLPDPCLENPMDRGARQATVRGVAKSQAPLSNYPFLHKASTLLLMANLPTA